MGWALLWFIACGVVLNGLLCWWAWCWLIGWAAEIEARLRA